MDFNIQIGDGSSSLSGEDLSSMQGDVPSDDVAKPVPGFNEATPIDNSSTTHKDLDELAKVFDVKFKSRDTKQQKIDKIKKAKAKIDPPTNKSVITSKTPSSPDSAWPSVQEPSNDELLEILKKKEEEELFPKVQRDDPEPSEREMAEAGFPSPKNIKKDEEELDTSFDFGANVPPNKPPTTFNNPEPDPDDDDDLEGAFDPTIPTGGTQPAGVDTDKQRLREQRKEFQDERRREMARRKRISAERSEQQRQELNRRREEKKKSSERLSNLEKTSSSDRIVRRLSAFGIARTMGGSGQMFAAAMELGVFGPQERRENEALEAAKQEEYERIKQIEEADKQRQFQNKYDEINKSIDTDQLNADKKFELDETTDIAERDRIIDEYREQRKYRTGRQPGPAPTIFQSPIVEPPLSGVTQEPPTERTTTESGIPPGQPPQDPPTTDTSGGPEPDPENKPGTGVGDVITNLKEFGSTLNPITGTLLATTVALSGMKAASDSFTSAIKESRQSLTGNANEAANTAVTSIANAGKTAAGITGAGIGGAAGAYIGSSYPVIGTALGAAVGTAVGKVGADSIAEPIVGAIETGNAILGDIAKDSIGAATINASVNRDLLTSFKELDISLRNDQLTANFVEAQGGLSLALLDLKETVATELGDEMVNIVNIVTRVVKLIDTFFPIFQIGMQGILTILSVFSPTADSLLKLLLSLSENTEKNVDVNTQIKNLLTSINENEAMKEINDFLNTQRQFENENNQNRFGNTTSFFS